jgi:serine/threonine-protein kinase
VLAAVLRAEADWDSLPQDTPRSIRKLLRRCLTRERKQRLQAIGDARLELEDAMVGMTEPRETQIAGGREAARAWGRGLPWAVAGVLGAALLVALAGLERAPEPEPGVLTRFSLEFANVDSIGGACCGRSPALSPDGKSLAFTASSDGTIQIFLRTMDQMEANPVPGTENAATPFFSPDGRWFAFFTEGKLKKVSVEGGAPMTLCNVGSDPRGGTWGPNDAIVFASTGSGGLSRVPGGGGTPALLTELDAERGESSHRWPTFLPNGKAVLFTVIRKGGFSVEAVLLDSGERRPLVERGTQPLYASSGHLVYAQFEGEEESGPSGMVLAVPFDADQVEVTGSPVPVLEGVQVYSGGAGNLTLSQNGSLVFRPGAGEENLLVWVDREGNVEPLPESSHTFSFLRLSPDGKTLAVSASDATGLNIWIYDFGRETFSRLTFDPGAEMAPVWLPDGTRVAFSVSGENQIRWVTADGSAEPELLVTEEASIYPSSFSPDGKTLIYFERAGLASISASRLEGDHKQESLIANDFNNWAPDLSPDGQWLAYTSDESERAEIYVREFPGLGGKWQVSSGGGTEAAWSRDGRELFFRSVNRMMVVEIETSPRFTVSQPQVLFDGDFHVSRTGRSYDVSLDGKRFLMIQHTRAADATPTFRVALNWFEELRRRVPTGKN